MYVTCHKRPFAPAFGNRELILKVNSLYIERRLSQVCDMSAIVNHCITDTLGWLCDSLRKVSEYGEGMLTSLVFYFQPLDPNPADAFMQYFPNQAIAARKK